MPSPLSSLTFVLTSAILLRLVLLAWGLYQDSFSPLKYTDIDYFVFIDAARFLSHGRSPYDRDTYRYTPLLAWLLLPSTWGGLWFNFGKVLFATADIVAGYLVFVVLESSYKMSRPRALKFASVWLLNPMVANISTRGSSEGLLGVLAAAQLWALMNERVRLAGAILGFAVHFKIYPFIYASSIVWWLESGRRDPTTTVSPKPNGLIERCKSLLNRERIELVTFSFGTFLGLNAVMYYFYGYPFIHHTYLHHLTRIDHRHNFSPYSTVLYLNSSPAASTTLHFESLAFIPQLFLSIIALPLVLAKKDLAATMLAQTFAFVAWNKVCTSQYFLWYMIFLPFYLHNSSLLRNPVLGSTALVLWVVGQAVWLYEGYQLEFLGRSTFVPGLWLASLFFFLVNAWILGIIISDVFNTAMPAKLQKESKKRK